LIFLLEDRFGLVWRYEKQEAPVASALDQHPSGSETGGMLSLELKTDQTAPRRVRD
jgi:hypothetical protein